MSKWLRILVWGLFGVLLIGSIIGILTAAVKGVFWGAFFALIMIGAMLYFATDGFNKREG
jgi:hypothetical protein